MLVAVGGWVAVGGQSWALHARRRVCVCVVVDAGGAPPPKGAGGDVVFGCYGNQHARWRHGVEFGWRASPQGQTWFLTLRRPSHDF